MPNGGVSGYAAINARVRAMHATLLKPETWAVLCMAENSSLLNGQLKDTAYGPYLARVSEENLTPRRAIYQTRRRRAGRD